MGPYRYLILIILSFATLCSCAGKDNPDNGTKVQEIAIVSSKVKSVMGQLWSSSPLSKDISTGRQTAFSEIQKFADSLSSSSFTSFLSASDILANALEKNNSILQCYDSAFDRILDFVKKDNPPKGEVYIYMLYNMGYVVKSSQGCFGIDIYHRRGAELAPYLDFCCSTHIHQDHKCIPLFDAMIAMGKPVISNYYTAAGIKYTKEIGADYTIGPYSIHTFITNHNNGDSNVPITCFQITFNDSGNFVLLHSGDSNYIATQFDITSPIDVYIPRYAVSELTENNVIGSLFQPKYVLLSHILELSHTDASSSRWTLQQGLERASKLNCTNSFMPFWGEKLIWKNGVLY